MKNLMFIFLLCSLAASAQTDTSAFEKYTRTEDFKQTQKRVREKEISDSVNNIPNVESQKKHEAYLKECDEQNKRTEAWLKQSEKENANYEAKMIKKYGKTAVSKVTNGSLWVGITDELCLYGLTEPNRRKTTYTKGAKTEMWIYQGQASGCVGSGCPYLDYVITFQNHEAIAITTGD